MWKAQKTVGLMVSGNRCVGGRSRQVNKQLMKMETQKGHKRVRQGLK